MRVVLISVMAISMYCTVKAQPITEQLIYQGKLVNVYIEKAIYHAASHENFLIKIRIENVSNKRVGTDLSDYWKVIYPNQWGLYTKPQRDIIDEERMIPDKSFDKEGLLKDFNDRILTYIEPGESFDYYRDWNGSGEQIQMTEKDTYLIITVDGQLLITDGKKTEQILIGDDEEMRAVIFSYPIINRTIPQQGIIVYQ